MVHGLIATSAMRGMEQNWNQKPGPFPGSDLQYGLLQFIAVVILTPTSHT